MTSLQTTKQQANSFFFELLTAGNYDKIKSIVHSKVMNYGDPAELPDDRQLEYYYYTQILELVRFIEKAKEESCRIAKLRNAYEFFSRFDHVNVKDFSL